MVPSHQQPLITTPDVSRRMAAQRVKDTAPELLLRRNLHARGLRYRLHQQPVPTVRRNLDIIFRPVRVAVEVRGCFWHQCPEHATFPRQNQAWWAAKLGRNRDRDLETEQLLTDAGWVLVVVWEHDQPSEAAARIEALVRSRRRTSSNHIARSYE